MKLAPKKFLPDGYFFLPLPPSEGLGLPSPRDVPRAEGAQRQARGKSRWLMNDKEEWEGEKMMT